MAQKGLLTTADYLPIDEYKRFVNGLRDDGYYLWEMFCRMSFWTACRSSDVLNLRWKDVLNTEYLNRIEQKTGKQRLIEFNKEWVIIIEELYSLLGSPPLHQLIFISPRTGKSYTVQYVNYMLKKFRFRYKLSIKQFSTHTFRKTFGRYVYESNGRSAEALVLLNSIFKHSSTEITKIYIGIRSDEISKVYSSITF